tara:strand:- start:21247 stop:22008 length:762 start_codon:yes stop_codon:yes gene_type:complete
MKKDKKNTKKIILFLIIVLIIFILISNGNNIEKKEIIEDVDKYTELRKNMVEQQLKTRYIIDEKVLDVMGKIERHKFVPDVLKNNAYDDNPLPIGYGQTISQPYIVALMTQALEVDKNNKVLELGTGSGYQAAVLSKLVKEVYTIEIISKLADSAEQRLKNLGYNNVKVKNADGYFGWEEFAPYDAIIVTAAANHIPLPLLEQLKDNGKLIIPLGSTLTFQTLTLVTKKGNDLETEFITGVRFVPLTGKALEK